MEAVFARQEHGGYKVLPQNNGIKVFWPQGPKTYRSARKAIMALVNRTPDPDPRGYDPHLTFDRYFRKGRYARWQYPALDTLEMFSDESLSISEEAKEVSPQPLVVHVPLGIDLENRAHEVRKLFFAGFGRTAVRKGYDPEDVLQEVYKALLVRNQGKCPWDPRKSSFGHYVHMVCRGTMSNYTRRYSRLSRNEQFGVRTHDGQIIDVAASDAIFSSPNQDNLEHRDVREFLLRMVLKEAHIRDLEEDLVEKTFYQLSEGRLQKEIASTLEISCNKVSRFVKMIRTVSARWAQRA